MTNESKALLLYVAAAINLVVGFWILIGYHDDFVAGEASTVSYVLRGLGPLLIAATFIFLARNLRAKDDPDNA